MDKGIVKLQQTVIIRKAEHQDVTAVLNVRKQAILAGCKDAYDSTQLDLWTGVSADKVITDMIVNSFYVSKMGNEIVGTGKVDLTTGQIDGIFVLPSHFGLGLARAMLTFLEQKAKAHGLTKLFLDATLNAVNAYSAYGFIADTPRNYESPTGAVLRCVPMQKEIK